MQFKACTKLRGREKLQQTKSTRQELKWLLVLTVVQAQFLWWRKPLPKVLKSHKFLGSQEGSCGEVCAFCPDTPTNFSSAYLNQWAICDAVFCSHYRFIVPAGCSICTDWIIY